MASKLETVAYVREQMSGAGVIEARKMFGEFAIYCDGKVVALVCDDTLFIKPTEAGRKLLGVPVEAPPYPGARPHFRADEFLDDQDRLSALIAATARELPLPPPRKKKSSLKPASRARGASR